MLKIWLYIITSQCCFFLDSLLEYFHLYWSTFYISSDFVYSSYKTFLYTCHLSAGSLSIFSVHIDLIGVLFSEIKRRKGSHLQSMAWFLGLIRNSFNLALMDCSSVPYIIYIAVKDRMEIMKIFQILKKRKTLNPWKDFFPLVTFSSGLTARYFTFLFPTGLFTLEFIITGTMEKYFPSLNSNLAEQYGDKLLQYQIFRSIRTWSN